jgi:hypothetical protein
MATLQVRDVDSRLYESLKRDNLETETQTLEYLKSTNSWHDDNNAEDLIAHIRSSRSKSNRSSLTDKLFD